MELDCMQNPYNGLPLHWATRNGRKILTDGADAFFPLRNGYPNFLAGQKITGLNHKFQRLYDRIGRIAGVLERFFGKFTPVDHLRDEWLQGLQINPGDRVLEVSVGTGRNLRYLPAFARYFGLDISSGMLDRCNANARKWGLNVDLCQANAEYLPYRDNSFDSVFHIGGINFFNNRGRAIREMLRVARPGARIVIIDATEKALKNQYRKIPFASRYFCEANIDRSRLYAPAQFVPDEVRDVEVKLISNGSRYRLSFVKPLNYPAVAL